MREAEEHPIKTLPPVTSARKRGHWNLLDECANSGIIVRNVTRKWLKRDGAIQSRR